MKKVLLLMLVVVMFSMAACGNNDVATWEPTKMSAKDFIAKYENTLPAVVEQHINFCSEHFKEEPKDLAEFYIVVINGGAILRKEDGTPITTAEAIDLLAAELCANEELAKEYRDFAKAIMYARFSGSLSWIQPTEAPSTPDEAYRVVMQCLTIYHPTPIEPLAIDTNTGLPISDEPAGSWAGPTD